MFNLILFDLDGTLTDPKIGITKSVQYALDSIGIHEDDIEKLTPFIGPPLKEMFMSYCGVDEQMGDFLVAKYRERFSVTGLFENSIYDGIKELLENLKADGKKIALATSKPQIFSEQILEHFDIKEYFDILVGSELNGNRTNKAEVIKEVIKQSGSSFNIETAVMVGDRMYDIAGAKSAGIRSVGVTYGYGGKEELEKAGPDYIVSDVKELGRLLSES